MSLLVSILSFLVAIAVLVVVHEFGHYQMARWCGVRVLRFSVGFGRTLWQRVDRHGTQWAVCAVPLGGYVRMLDEDDELQGPLRPGERSQTFQGQSIPRRAAIVVAGPVSNLVFAVLAYTLVFAGGVDEARPFLAAPASRSPAQEAGIHEGDLLVTVGERPVASWSQARMAIIEQGPGAAALALRVRGVDGTERDARLDLEALSARTFDDAWFGQTGLEPGTGPAVVRSVVADGAAARAGVVEGDRILEVDGRAIDTAGVLTRVVRAAPGVEQHWRVSRGGRTLEITVVPAAIEDPKGGARTGRVGLAFSDLTRVRRGPAAALRQALSTTRDMIGTSLHVMGLMVRGQGSWRNLSGPVAMADIAGQSAQAGSQAFLEVLGFLSISLGVLNLLPIPVLDGGHLLYYLAELLTGKPLPRSVIEPAQRLGVALLVFLGLVAFVSDITRLIS